MEENPYETLRFPDGQIEYSKGILASPASLVLPNEMVKGPRLVALLSRLGIGCPDIFRSSQDRQ